MIGFVNAGEYHFYLSVEVIPGVGPSLNQDELAI
jgi:hypothetical protein